MEEVPAELLGQAPAAVRSPEGEGGAGTTCAPRSANASPQPMGSQEEGKGGGYELVNEGSMGVAERQGDRHDASHRRHPHPDDGERPPSQSQGSQSVIEIPGTQEGWFDDEAKEGVEVSAQNPCNAPHPCAGT